MEIYDNKISDVSALAGLKNLTTLWLHYNEISDVSALAGLKNLKDLQLHYNRIVDFAPIAELERRLEVYRKSPQLKSLIPHAVEISGPTTVTSVVKDYTFTATVKNANNQGLRNVEVTVNNGQTVRTNGKGEAEFKLNFRSVGAHNINVRVRDKERKTEFQRHFSNRVTVPAPASIELVEDRKEIPINHFYMATFVVKSAAGQTLEGFDVKMSVGQWVFEKIGAEDMIVPIAATRVDLFDGPPDFFTNYDINAREVTRQRIWNGYLVSRVPSDNEGELVFSNFDIFGWRVKSVPSNNINTDSTNSEGKARCSQRLSSMGQYGVSATVLLNGQAFLTTSFSDREGSNKIFINPGKTIKNEPAAFYTPGVKVPPPGQSGPVVAPGWLLIKAEDDRRTFKWKWGAPVDPPSYRVTVVSSTGACETVVPSAEILSLAAEISALTPPPQNSAYSISYATIQVPLSQIADEPMNTLAPNSTSSLDPTLRWTPLTTVAKDIGIPVITVRLVGGTVTERDLMRETFREWERESKANLHFIFTDEDDEPADIGVALDPGIIADTCKGCPSYGGRSSVGSEAMLKLLEQYQVGKSQVRSFWDNVGEALFSWAGYKLEIEKWQTEYKKWQSELWGKPTMWITARDNKGLTLHEVGHALGFYHTHQSSAFDKVFDNWPPPGKENDTDYKIVQLPDTASVDPKSVMTYHVPPEDLFVDPKVRPDTENLNYLKYLAETTGIPADNEALSAGDLQALRNVYGPRPETDVQMIYGRVYIDGVDDETWPASNDTINTFHEVEIYVGHQETYTFTFLTEFKWGGECRVEVDIGARRIKADGSIEMAAKVRFFEGTHENTRDLEDSDIIYFTVPNDHTKKTNEKIYVNNPGPGEDDHATVTFQLGVPLIGISIPIPEAPSLGVASSDVNSDGHVNADDLVIVSNYLGQPAPQTPPVDVNGDGAVTIADLVYVAQDLGESTTASAPVSVVFQMG